MKDFGSKIHNFFTDVIVGNNNGIKSFEVNFKLKNGKIFYDSIVGIANELNLYNPTTKEFGFLDTSKIKVEELRAIIASGLYDKLDFNKLPKQDCAPEKIFRVTSLDGDNDNPFMNGFTVSFSLGYFYKSYDIKFLQKCLEKTSEPTVDVEYDEVNPETKNQAEKIATNVKKNARVTRPKNIAWKYVTDETKGTVVTNMFKALQYWDDGFSTRATGQADTMSKMGQDGARAAMEVKERIASDITLGHLKLITWVMDDQFIKRIIDLNFANPPAYPRCKFNELKSLEQKKLIAEIVQIFTDSGFDVDEAQITELINLNLKKSAKPDAEKSLATRLSKMKVPEDKITAYTEEILKLILEGK